MSIKNLIILIILIGISLAGYFFLFSKKEVIEPIVVDFTIDNKQTENTDDYIHKPKKTELNKVYIQIPYESIQLKTNFNSDNINIDEIRWEIKSKLLDTTFSNVTNVYKSFDKKGEYLVTLNYKEKSVSKWIYIVDKKTYAKLNPENVNINNDSELAINDTKIKSINNNKNNSLKVKELNKKKPINSNSSTPSILSSDNHSNNDIKTAPISETLNKETSSSIIEPKDEIINKKIEQKKDEIESKVDPIITYKLEIARKEIKQLLKQYSTLEKQINSFDKTYYGDLEYDTHKNILKNIEFQKAKIIDYNNFNSTDYSENIDEVESEVKYLKSEYSLIKSDIVRHTKNLEKLSQSKNNEKLKEEKLKEEKRLGKLRIEEEKGKNSPPTPPSSSSSEYGCNSRMQIGLSSIKRCDIAVMTDFGSVIFKPRRNVELQSLTLFSKKLQKITITLKGNDGTNESISPQVNPGKTQIFLTELYPYLSKGKTYTLSAKSHNSEVIFESAKSCAKNTYTDENMNVNYEGEIIFYNIKYCF